MYRALICWTLMALLSGEVVAADAAEAMIYGQADVMLNGSSLPNSSAMFPGDKVETKSGSAARINFTGGATAAIAADTSFELERNALRLNHGTVSLVTANLTSVHDCEITVTPVVEVHTEFEVSDVNGRVRVKALTGDVSLDDHAHTVTVKQGEQADREKACKVADQKRVLPPAPWTGSPLTSKYVIAAGVGGAGVIVYLLWPDHDDMSPSSPKSGH